ncbi:exopolysaccharide Pel transporter PelG [bacterium]|nr:exopolysaccharide Pel transporter PelG [bacterium]
MAGIGFELRKLFAKKGIFLKFRANFYATLVVTGPMILGVVLLLGAKVISSWAGASGHQQDIIIVVITYSLLFSLLLSSLVLFVLARYIADMMYMQELERILPSMYGAMSLLLIVGGIGWGVFLFLSRLPFQYAIFSFILFCESLIVWVQINYITATKDFRIILIGYFWGILLGLLFGFLLAALKVDIITSLLVGACVAYGIILVRFTEILHRYFPMGSGTSFKFLAWIEKYPRLTFVGFFTTLGLFIHLMLMWGSPWGVQVVGLFYHAPQHDIPALLAFATGLISTVYFVTSVETSVYLKYRIYFGLLNGEGALSDIQKAYDNLMDVLEQQLFYLSLQQVIVTILSIVVIGETLLYLNLGFTSVMIGLFRVLCVGYGLFAIGNSFIMFLLYFTNYRGALLTAVFFLFVNTVGTVITMRLPEVYYGFGFVAAGLVTYLAAYYFLTSYSKKLDYYVFSTQPIFFVEKNGWLTRIAEKFDAKSMEASR